MARYMPLPGEERQRAEAVLLGKMLLRSQTAGAMRDLLRPEDFSEERHRLIYEALLAVASAPDLAAADAVTTLLTPDELERVGGRLYLTFLQQQAEDDALPIEEQLQVLQLATLHSLLEQVEGALHASASQETGDLERAANDLERARRITQHLFLPGSTFTLLPNSFQAGLDAYLGELEARRRHHTTLTGIPTGFADLDRMTGGLQRSDLVVVAGPPSVGKTSFALSVALHVLLEERRSVGLFSLETPARRVIERLLSMEARLDQRLLRSLEMMDDEWQRLGAASALLSSANLWIDDTANLSTTELRDKAHLVVARGGVGLLIVDYVHLMRSSVNDRRHENRVQEIGEISRSLKAIARELDLPVLALAQVSRAFESRPAKELHLSDLRDGSLENDADLVLFLSVSEADSQEVAGEARLATISIAKHRNGPRAGLEVCFLPSTTRFCDWPTLSHASIPDHLSEAAPAPLTPREYRFPRLQEIMAQAMQRRARQGEAGVSGTVKQDEQSRALPMGAVLEDEEGDGDT
jgi:replicative DNA helicase